MEQSNESLFGLEFDHQAAAYITESAKWSRFMSIVWFILCGLFIIFAIFAGSMIASLGSSMTGGIYGAGMGGFVTALYLVLAAIQLVPNIFRYQFATKALQAIRNSDQSLLNESLGKLKTYNKYWGIVTIIILSIYILAFLFGILGALMR
jgi:uncharacterized membrane protein